MVSKEGSQMNCWLWFAESLTWCLVGDCLHSEVVRESWRKARLQRGGSPRTRKPPLPGLETRSQGGGGYEMQGALECIWANATLRPSAVTVARLYTTRPVDASRHGRADDIVPFAKLNDFYLGGVHFFGHLRPFLTSQNCDARYSHLLKMSINLLRITLHC